MFDTLFSFGSTVTSLFSSASNKTAAANIYDDEYDPENTAHTEHVNRVIERFNLDYSTLLMQDGLRAGIILAASHYMFDFSLYAVVADACLLAASFWVVPREAKSTKFEESKQELLETYEWCKAANSEAEIVDKMRRLLAPLAQPEHFETTRARYLATKLSSNAKQFWQSATLFGSTCQQQVTMVVYGSNLGDELRIPENPPQTRRRDAIVKRK